MHDPEWEADQDNVTTAIRWGDAIDEIRDRAKTGMDFHLYQPDSTGDPYVIEIA